MGCISNELVSCDDHLNSVNSLTLIGSYQSSWNCPVVVRNERNSKVYGSRTVGLTIPVKQLQIVFFSEFGAFFLLWISRVKVFVDLKNCYTHGFRFVSYIRFF